MWAKTFAGRLESWYSMRQQCRDLSAESALELVNSWWFTTPWQPYYLDWLDLETWPDPWQLLSDNVYCDLARAVGIMYTITMLERDDITAVELADTDQGNLVLVNQGKYILNWHTSDELNIPSKQFTINQRLDRRAIHHLTDR